MGAPHGQHFLVNRGALATILRRFAPLPGDRIVEIGPGRGALTRDLLARAGALAAVEIDRELAAPLAAELGLPLLQEVGAGAGSPRPGFILLADALDVRYANLAASLGAGPADRLRVIGNLPYSVATALLQRMAAERDLIEDAMLMIQREVADRILASPGSKTYGILSVLFALVSERARILSLGPRSFSPPPKVDSAVIGIRFRRPEPGFRDTDARLLALLKAAFSERRKKVAGNLAKRYAIDRARAAELLAAAGADPGARAEQLTPEAYLRLAALLHAN